LGCSSLSQATARTGEIERSVFAGLRRQHPDLVPQVLRKATLLALTRAVEDECCARAEQAALFASFQHQRNFCRTTADDPPPPREAREAAQADAQVPAQRLSRSLPPSTGR
jgi:DICT domain-containing protein